MSIQTRVAVGLATAAVALTGGTALATTGTTHAAPLRNPTPQTQVDRHKRATHEHHAPMCRKHLTAVFTVGTGTSAVQSLSNGCWTTIDADGAANPAFRKCSSSNFVVRNPHAPNFALDDTNITEVSADRSFLARCSAGAHGTGFEYMADRGAWALLPSPHIKAYFSELYTTDGSVDNLIGDYPHRLDGHTVPPMINIGPDDPSAIHSGALDMSRDVENHGYFGVYNGDWEAGMTASDPRAQALARALNQATR